MSIRRDGYRPIVAAAMERLRRSSPAQILMFYYALSILIGTLLLGLPLASAGEPLSLLDALFTATSAQCVTGLTVIDVGTQLSGFGQGVLLFLIQIGGLGITTFSVYLFIYLHVGVSIRGRWIINETLMHTPVGSWRDLIIATLRVTLIIELIGTLLLSTRFIPELGLWQGLYSALFHSVSAFCNAGFSLFSDSLIGYRSDPIINLTIMVLIILGGIGFLVIRELLHVGRERSKKGRRWVSLSLHSKIVLSTTFILIVLGALTIYLLERNAAFANLGSGETFWLALFQSITARTAGFNTIELSNFRLSTLFLICFLMLVGASPGSAGGGIKTTSLALFYAVFVSRLKGSPHATIFRRTIPNEAINKTLVLVTLALVLVGVSLFALLVAQTPGLAQGELRQFMAYFFEVFSAFGTVGLTIGATAELNPLGKVVIIILMFIGRVGLLTMAFAIAGRMRKNAPRYAEENIMIG